MKVPKSPSRFTGIAVIVAVIWIAMMASLVYDELWLPYRNQAPYTRQTWRAQDIWLGVYAGEARIGFINLRTTPRLRNQEPGMRMEFNAELSLSLFSRETAFSMAGHSWVAEQGGLRSFDFRLETGKHRMRVSGALEENTLKATVESGGECIPFNFPVDKDIVLGGGMGIPALDVPLLKPGQELYVDAFDPVAMRMGKARLKCIARETLQIGDTAVEAFHIETTVAGIVTNAWVSAEEELLRAETPFGFALEKISPNEALTPVTPGKQSDFIERYAVYPEGVQPTSGARMMRVDLTGINPAQLPEGDLLQTRTSTGYSITMADLSAIPAETPLAEAASAAALADDAFVTSAHPRILKQALEITAGVEEPWEKAKRIYDWVYEHITKTPVVSIPSALDVLETREGDCNEHTVLFTALARAAGVPTRIAIGLVWSDELGAFGYHAWPEVWRGAWIPMDPTLGQLLADATHIKLLNGGIDQWTRLIAYIGKIRLVITEVESAQATGAL